MKNNGYAIFFFFWGGGGGQVRCIMGNVEVAYFSLSLSGFSSAPTVFPSRQRLTQIPTRSGTDEHQSPIFSSWGGGGGGCKRYSYKYMQN